MSFIIKSQSRSRPWSAKFHVKRMRDEDFSKPYYEPTPEYQFVKMLLAYPKGFGDWYYMKVGEYVNTLLAVTRDVAEDKGWGFVKDVALLARKEGLVKDPPLVVGELLPARDAIAELLAEYPASKIHLFAVLARKKLVPTTWGRMKKKAIERVLNTWSVEHLEFQAIKYKNYMGQLVKMVHPRPASDEVSNIFGWVVGKKEPPSERARLRDMIAEGKLKGNEALAKAIDYDLPWEIARANVSLDSIDPGLFKEAVRRIFSHFDIAMQLSTIVGKLGTEETIRLVEDRRDRVPLAPMYRAIIGMLLSNRYSEEVKDMVRELDAVLEPRANQVLSQFKKAVRKDVSSKVIALIDESGSMDGGAIRIVVEVLAPLYRAVDRFFIFRGGGLTGNEIREVAVWSIDDVASLTLLPEGGTPLWDALIEVGNIARKEDALLLVFTDEQENVSRYMPADVESVLRDVPTVVINPAPYPTDFIPKERGSVVGLPGGDINAVLAGIRIHQINQFKQTAGKVDVSALRELGLVTV